MFSPLTIMSPNDIIIISLDDIIVKENIYNEKIYQSG